MTTPSGRESGVSPTLSGLDAQAQLLARLRHATLGEYEILAELGRGGMASVYVAHDIALDRKVALKVMSPALVYGEGMVERFKREARTAAGLSHPNIIPVYAVREADGLLFFVMKLIPGTPLDVVIREMGPLPIPMVEAILTQVGSAIGYAHRQGVIHRDVKPGNILIDDEGWAVVTDFGIAKVAEADGLTLTGMAVGTPAYMSPEQCESGDLTGASDQYSLGIVAYEMLTGRPPFGEAALVGIMIAHATRAAPPLLERRPDCPPKLAEVVERMLRKRPDERWFSMEDAVAAIGARSLTHDDPTRTKLIELARTGMARKLVQQARTPRSPIPLGRDRPAPTAHGQVPAPHRRASWLVAAGALGGVALAGMLGLALLRRAPVPPDGTPASAESAAAPGESVLQPTPPPAPRAPEPAAPARPLVSEGPPRAVPPPAPVPAPPPAMAERDTPVAEARPQVVQAPLAAPVPDTRVNEPATPPPVDDRTQIERVILDYAAALTAGRLPDALRLFPDMPAEQREGLEAFYGEGGVMETRWTVSEVVTTGQSATLRIQGVNLVRTPRSRPSEQRVNLRARLERGPSGWRLTALVN